MDFVYVLYSKKFNRFYVGHTNNLSLRLKEHSNGKTKSTKAFVPWKLVYSKNFRSRSEAIVRERFLKSGASREFFKSKFNAPVAQQDRASVS